MWCCYICIVDLNRKVLSTQVSIALIYICIEFPGRRARAHGALFIKHGEPAHQLKSILFSDAEESILSSTDQKKLGLLLLRHLGILAACVGRMLYMCVHTGGCARSTLA